MEQCNFTINLDNQAGLTQDQLKQVQTQIQAILGQTDDGHGDTLTATFTADAGADSIITLTNSSWYNPSSWGKLGNTSCPFTVCGNSSNVYVDQVKDSYPVPGSTENAIGATAAHEFDHEMVWQPPWSTHSSIPGNLMAATDSTTSGRAAPNWGTYLTQSQISDLFKKCQELHPPLNTHGGQNHSQGGGGGGGGGGGAGGAGGGGGYGGGGGGFGFVWVPGACVTAAGVQTCELGYWRAVF
jgi:uncharacterized membrane protein YgcG